MQHEEDEAEFSLVHQAATGQTGCTAAATFPATLQEALKNIRIANDLHTARQNIFYIQRSRAWNNVVQEARNVEFKTYRMSAEFIGESATDNGGPTRELFSLIYEDIMDSKLIRGSMPNLTFSHDLASLWAGEYKIFGQLTALAFLNNASLPHFFSPSVAYYILDKDYNAPIESLIEEIPTDQAIVKEKLNSLSSAATPDEWNKRINEFDERFDMGINQAHVTLEEKEFLIRMANKHIMRSGVVEEILSYQDGLSLFGVLGVLKRFPEEAVKFFTAAELTTEDIRNSFSPSFSLKGSSKRPSEETVAFNFNQFLKQCARGRVQRTFADISSLESSSIMEEKQRTLTLNDVLRFLSGARHLPPGGFCGTIQFVHDATEGQRLKANTCALKLCIPVNDRYCSDNSSVFVANMADDIFDSQTFGCA